jgi:hypothetical protein
MNAEFCVGHRRQNPPSLISVDQLRFHCVVREIAVR